MIERMAMSSNTFFELIASSAGLTLLVFGMLNVCRNLAFYPHTLTGAIAYSTAGIYFSLTFSTEFRMFFMSKLLSKEILTLLYNKSLIEVLMESTPSSKIYTLIAISPLLRKDELKVLIDSLPEELAYVRRPGLVHLLPESVQLFLSGSRSALTFADDPNDNSAATDDDGESTGGSGSYFSVSRNLGPSFDDPSAPNISSSENFINVIHDVLRSNSSVAINDVNGNSFDSTLFSIGSKKFKNVIDFIQKRIADNVTKSLYYFVNFGNVSDATLVTTSAISVASLILLNNTSVRSFLSNKALLSNYFDSRFSVIEGVLSKAYSKNKKTIRFFISLLRNLVAISTVTTSGSVIFRLLAKNAINKINSSNASSNSLYGFSPIKILRTRTHNKSNDYNDPDDELSNVNVISNAAVDIYTKIKERFIAMVNYKATVEISFQKFTSIILLATILMSLRLKTDFKNMAWLYTILYNKALNHFNKKLASRRA